MNTDIIILKSCLFCFSKFRTKDMHGLDIFPISGHDRRRSRRRRIDYVPGPPEAIVSAQASSLVSPLFATVRWLFHAVGFDIRNRLDFTARDAGQILD